MASLDSLRSQGWYLSSDGLRKLCENDSVQDIRSITRKALDIDLRDIGAPVIASEIYKDFFGPVVLQIAKVRNVSESKAKPKSQTAPRMLKLNLTDGHTNCQGIEIKNIPALSLDNAAPGTKLLINGAPILSGCLLLDIKCCKVLGGNVALLIEKWEMAKLMPNHIRVTEDGPPAWVNFGKKIATNLNNQGFKSLENKNKENSKEDAEFLNQRQDAISEAAQGAVKKIFGGGMKNPPTFSSNEQIIHQPNNSNIRASRPSKNKTREKSEPEKVEKPSQRVSLFDFLEDKLPVPEMQNRNSNNSNIKLHNNEKNNFIETSKESRYRQQNKIGNSDRREYDNSTRTVSGTKYHSDRNRFSNERNYDNIPWQGLENHYQQNKFNDRRKNENTWQNDQSVNNFGNDYHELDSKYTNDNRYQRERPPRFQKQRFENTAKFSNQSEPKQEKQFQNIFQDNIPKFQNITRENKTKPHTNNFINKIASEMNNISLYNTKYENEKLHKPSNESTVQSWKWNIGDRCMAKYWEDNKFYNAIVTGVTNRTCLVEFLEYGNFEEVLHADCIPVTTDRVKHNNKPFADNQQFSGSIEFRYGKNRPFIKNQKGSTENRKYES